jgi:hypothetical protein
VSDEEIEDAFKLWLHWDFAVADLAKGKPDAFCECCAAKADIRPRAPVLGRPDRRHPTAAAIKHLKRQRRGDSRATLLAARKDAIYDLAQRYGRTWDTTEKRFKQALAELRRVRSA